MKRLKNLTVSLLLLLVVSMSLKAQGGYTFTPIMGGRFFATEHNTKHTRGIMKGELMPNNFEYYSGDELKNLVVVPVAYDDIRLTKVFYQNGYFADQYSFNAVVDGTYTVYTFEGKKLFGPVSSNIGFLADVLSLPYHLVATQCQDGGQGFDLNILVPLIDPITVRGPFEYAYYQEAKAGDRTYYVINAKKLGKEEFAVYDVVGNLIPQDRLGEIADYYEKMGDGYAIKYDLDAEDDSKKAERFKNISLAALCGQPRAVRAIVKAYYDPGYFDPELAMLADAVQDAEALYYVGLSYLNGRGTKVVINFAKSFFQMADKLGYNPSSAQLAKIAAIETPVKLATGPQTHVDDMTDPDLLRELAEKGNLEAIKIYCHQSLFFSFGSAFINSEDLKHIDDEDVVDVLPMLLAGAEKDANCQFMLACVYGGPEAMGAVYPDYQYSFRNVEKAHYWINRFKSNPERDSAWCWGYSSEDKEAIISNILALK